MTRHVHRWIDLLGHVFILKCIFIVIASRSHRQGVDGPSLRAPRCVDPSRHSRLFLWPDGRRKLDYFFGPVLQYLLSSPREHSNDRAPKSLTKDRVMPARSESRLADSSPGSRPIKIATSLAHKASAVPSPSMISLQTRTA